MAIRRSNHDPRIELAPLIDVVFLLLVFFVYAMVLMVRVELVPMDLRSFVSGVAADPAPAITISIALDGTLAVDREPVALDDLADRVRAAAADRDDARVYLAVADGESTVDRAPVLQDVWDRLRDVGLEIALVGRPDERRAP